ncbi:hypothetical protein [Clostridium sp. ZS2-4]|uniref:hypothetical protein n=1 Tax=Clostridium sp. ZS2-4 TaxID=2987703 RepID=UPI00227C4937|nr:hypothetical protein [Clostridium sp. ZS2-4]MCY6354485.1 hypothetical protein [Clostridium sp. ZS2-4]
MKIKNIKEKFIVWSIAILIGFILTLTKQNKLLVIITITGTPFLYYKIKKE